MIHPSPEASTPQIAIDPDACPRLASCSHPGDETFRFAPIPILIEDWSGIRQWVDARKAEGVTDLEAYLDANPMAIQELRDRHHVFVDANDAALALFDADSRASFFAKASNPQSGSPRAKPTSAPRCHGNGPAPNLAMGRGTPPSRSKPCFTRSSPRTFRCCMWAAITTSCSRSRTGMR